MIGLASWISWWRKTTIALHLVTYAISTSSMILDGLQWNS
jgi:hypothetical protein